MRKAAAGQKKLTVVEVLTHAGGKVKQTTVATEQDMLLMIKALSDMGFKNVVFVADQLWDSATTPSSDGRASTD